MTADINALARRRQWIVAGGLLSVLVTVAGAAVYYIEQARVPPAPVGKPVGVLNTSELSDERGQWRAKEGARIRALEDALAKATAEREADKKEFDTRLNKADQVKKERMTADAGVGATRNSGDAPIEDTGLMSRPLPVRAQSVGLIAPQSTPAAPSSPVEPVSPAHPPRRIYKLSASPDQDKDKVVSSRTEGAKPVAQQGTSAQEIAFIPATSHVRVRSLNGVLAPAHPQSSATPHPIFFEIEGEVIMPNGARYDLTGCRVSAVAWGVLSEERVHARTENLACVIDGETIQVAVKGSVMGDDGMHGLPGKIVEKQGQMILNSVSAAIMSGIGQSFALSNVTQSDTLLGASASVTPGRAFEAGFGRGLGNSFDRISEYYLRAANNLHPAIEVGSAIPADLVFSLGVKLPIPAGSRNAFTSLLHKPKSKDLSDED